MTLEWAFIIVGALYFGAITLGAIGRTWVDGYWQNRNADFEKNYHQDVQRLEERLGKQYRVVGVFRARNKNLMARCRELRKERDSLKKKGETKAYGDF